MMVAFQGLILVFFAVLVYFTLIYYPNSLNKASLSVTFKPFFKDKVVVNTANFPLVTDSYKITYASDSNLYYVFVEGSTLPVYIDNKLAAQLSLKNTLSLESLCSLKIIYMSVSQIELDQKYTRTSGC